MESLSLKVDGPTTRRVPIWEGEGVVTGICFSVYTSMLQN